MSPGQGNLSYLDLLHQKHRHKRHKRNANGNRHQRLSQRELSRDFMPISAIPTLVRLQNILINSKMRPCLEPQVRQKRQQQNHGYNPRQS